MSSPWKSDYKGYGIVPGASWSYGQPFKAHYVVTSTSGVSIETVNEGVCEGTFRTEDEAWQAALSAARRWIDGLLQST